MGDNRERQRERQQQLTDRQRRLSREAHTASPVLVLITIIATLGILAYAWYLLRPDARGDLLPYILVITAETILVAQALLSMWTILSAGPGPRDFAYFAAQQALFPADQHVPQPFTLGGRPVCVDVLITVYGEPLETIRRTAEAARAMDGPHTTWILDDGRSDDVRELAALLGVGYIRRLSSGGAKAGNVNHALTITRGDFFAIFDADFVPEPNFLRETLPFMIDETVAFVQTPQRYGNLDTVIARGAAYMQAMFYRFVQPGRNRFNAAFCVGTNVLFRRTAIDSIGGMYTDSKSEDVWTSLRLHDQGWRSIYIPDVLAIGDAPETVEAYSKQQLRWASGGFEILLTSFPLSRKLRLTPDQRLQYLVTATFYLTGICPLLLLMVPPLEIFFDLRPISMDMPLWQWALFYSGFYLMQILLAWFVMGSFRWETLTLATASFPIYTKALWNVLSGKDEGWHVTGASRGRNSPWNFVIPQIVTFVFLALTSVVAIVRDVGNGVATIATVWNVLNTGILALFLFAAWREQHPSRPRALAPDRGTLNLDTAPRTIVARPTLAPPTPAVSPPVVTLPAADDGLLTRRSRERAPLTATLADARQEQDVTP